MVLSFIEFLRGFLSGGYTPVADRLVFTPQDMVSNFIPLPTAQLRVKAIEPAWHEASDALDTERVRLVAQEADGGIYFLAADARTFIRHPHAVTPLAAALPGLPGHQGDGAYCQELGSTGLIAVVVKEATSLKSYVGSRADALKFAEGYDQFWPTVEHAQAWVGYRELENEAALRFARVAVASGMLLTAVFLLLIFLMSWKTSQLSNKREAHIADVREQQQQNVASLNANQKSGDAFTAYREQAAAIIRDGGELTQFKSDGNKISFEATFPAWASNIANLGPGLQIRIDAKTGDIVVRKGDF